MRSWTNRPPADAIGAARDFLLATGGAQLAGHGLVLDQSVGDALAVVHPVLDVPDGGRIADAVRVGWRFLIVVRDARERRAVAAVWVTGGGWQWSARLDLGRDPARSWAALRGVRSTGGRVNSALLRVPSECLSIQLFLDGDGAIVAASPLVSDARHNAQPPAFVDRAALEQWIARPFRGTEIRAEPSRSRCDFSR